MDGCGLLGHHSPFYFNFNSSVCSHHPSASFPFIVLFWSPSVDFPSVPGSLCLAATPVANSNPSSHVNTKCYR
jgi:hypothetical protein